jgi:hypothetical protein
MKERLDCTSMKINDFVESRRSWDAEQDTALLSELIGDLKDLPAGADGKRG